MLFDLGCFWFFGGKDTEKGREASKSFFSSDAEAGVGLRAPSWSLKSFRNSAIQVSQALTGPANHHQMPYPCLLCMINTQASRRLFADDDFFEACTRLLCERMERMHPINLTYFVWTYARAGLMAL